MAVLIFFQGAACCE
jgi:hypothetical protein